MSRRVEIAEESFPLADAFVISRGAKTQADIVSVSIIDGNSAGRGECVPYSRYGETMESVRRAIEDVRTAIEMGCTRQALQSLLPAGAARNAVDCALWDLEAKQFGLPAWQLAGLDRLPPTVTAYTISAGTPGAMATAAAKHQDRPILKIKLAGDGDGERLTAVREAAPLCQLIADANEAWAQGDVEDLLAQCAAAGVALVEQPLPAGADAMLADIHRPVPVCADESIHTSADLAALRQRYDAVNIKLDKTGGLTGALETARLARDLGYSIMIGSMVGSSLGAAPALLLSPFAQWVDLDGPLLLAKDREPGLHIEGSIIHPPTPALWG